MVTTTVVVLHRLGQGLTLFGGQHLAGIEQGSQVLTKSLADAAEVLTPDQRRTLAKFIEEHHGRHHHL